MADARQLIERIFSDHKVAVPKNRTDLFDNFLQKEQVIGIVNQILEKQQLLMDKWKEESRIADIIQQPVKILNATVGKPFETRIDFKKLKWDDLDVSYFEGLEELGLRYDGQLQQLMGVPVVSGDFKLKFRFKLKGESSESPAHEKNIPLIINPDPKSLWKNIPSDTNDPYWKEENVTLFSKFGPKYILVSSKRGRAHANIGSFREDDFTFKELGAGWNLVVVADGAGSAKFSRKGSAIACNAIADYLANNITTQEFNGVDGLLMDYSQNKGEDVQKKLTHFLYNYLGKGVFYVHKQLEEFASKNSIGLKDLNTTLVFTLFKKYDIGYAFLTFSVGDCPAAVLNKDISEVHLLNWLDVGEFGGGTRFVTMPEIFRNEKFITRFSFKLLSDFSYLVLMSDGIYDAKFVVEANLPDIKKWKQFLADLNGKNEDGVKVELNPSNNDITDQFSAWMDFWSQGNHDDRTLAIVF